MLNYSFMFFIPPLSSYIELKNIREDKLSGKYLQMYLLIAIYKFDSSFEKY